MRPPRPQTTIGGNLTGDLDIFEEDDEEEQPGPGAYYNPKSMSSFNKNKAPEKLQFFGSTSDRFGLMK